MLNYLLCFGGLSLMGFGLAVRILLKYDFVSEHNSIYSKRAGIVALVLGAIALIIGIIITIF